MLIPNVQAGSPWLEGGHIMHHCRGGPLTLRCIDGMAQELLQYLLTPSNHECRVDPFLTHHEYDELKILQTHFVTVKLA